ALALDSDPQAVASHNRNRPIPAAIRADLLQTNAADIARLWDRATHEAPIGVIGGPPCQALSVGNYRQVPTDPRRALPLRYAELLGDLVDRYNIQFFVFENVVGLMSARHSLYFEEIGRASCR